MSKNNLTNDNNYFDPNSSTFSLEYKGYDSKTPIRTAIDNENVYFLEVLSKIENTNFNVSLWEVLSEYKILPVPITKWILNNYFSIPQDEYPKLEYKSVSSVIKQAQSNQITFVTEIIIEESIELNSEDFNNLVSKIALRNELYLIVKLVEAKLVFDLNNKSFQGIVKKMVNTISQNKLDDKYKRDSQYSSGSFKNANCYSSNCEELYQSTIKFFLSNYEFNIENIQTLFFELPEIFLYFDKNGNNIFHKLALLKNTQNIGNFDNLLRDQVNTIADYLNSHIDNKKKYLKIYPKELFQLPNESNESPLQVGVKNNSYIFVKTFLNSQFLTWDDCDFDILHIAINSKPNEEIKEILQDYIFEKILNIKEEDFKDPKKTDHIASILIEKANSDTLVYIANIFIQNFWDFNFQSFSHMPERKTFGAGNTLLHKAVLWEYTDLINVLLKYDANPNLKNKEGFSPFLIAAAQNNEEIIYLLSNSSKINVATKDGNTPLHFFTMNSNGFLLKNIEEITKQKFEKEAKNKDGFIADDFLNLHYFYINNTEDQKELIENSVNDENDK